MLRHTFLTGISRYWWLPLFTGLICIALGIWTICAPASALPIMAGAFAWCLIFIGVFDAVWGLSTTRLNPAWGWDLVMAAIDIIAGVWMLTLDPAQMTMAFLYIVGIWIIFAAFSGVAQLMNVSIRNTWVSVLGMILLFATLLMTFWLLMNPVGLGVMAWMWIGIALICYGVFRLTIAFRIRKMN